MLQAFIALGSLPSRSSETHDENRQAYYVALEGVQRDHLTKAVKAILQGSLKHGFFPSPPELRMQCDQVRGTVRKGLAFFPSLPRPPEPTAEEKARAAAVYEEWKREIEAAAAKERLNDRAKLLDENFWDKVNATEPRVDYRTGRRLQKPGNGVVAEGDDDASI